MRVTRSRLIFLIFLLILAGLVVWFKVLPLGQATYSLEYPASANFFGGKGFIGRLSPADRVLIEPNQPAKIIGDPIYFSVFTPRTFSNAKITITYQNNLTAATPVIETGVLVDRVVWRYKTAPLENSLLDSGFSDWFALRSGDILLLQKNQIFSDVADFLKVLKNQPEKICGSVNLKSCLALYNADSLSGNFSNYQPGTISNFKKINIPLQGTHQFYFNKPVGNNFNFAFDFSDLNLNRDDDPVYVNIYQAGRKVYSQVISDGFGKENSGQSRNFSTSFYWTSGSSEPGLYKLEIKADDDIIIKDITSAPSALVALGRLHPVAAADSDLSFWTDSSFILATTDNPASRQVLNFANQNFSLDQTFHQFEFLSNHYGVKKVHLNSDDVILENDGTFSFDQNSFFNPEINVVDRHFVLSDNLKYILAKYQRPTVFKNNLKQATVSLDITGAYREKGKYSFIISIPGLTSVGQGDLGIKQIKIEFSGRTLWDKLKEKFSAYANKI